MTTVLEMWLTVTADEEIVSKITGKVQYAWKSVLWVLRGFWTQELRGCLSLKLTHL